MEMLNWKMVVQLLNGMYCNVLVEATFSHDPERGTTHSNIMVYLDQADGELYPLNSSEIIPKHREIIQQKVDEHELYMSF